MQRSPLADAIGFGANSRRRSASLSSDLQLAGRWLLLSPPAARPEPSFIAASAASQIITTDQERNLGEWALVHDHALPTGGALVTPACLVLLNGFLDNLLFNILSAAKSTQLTRIRSAISDVLKPRLAKEMISAADEELAEYMGNDDQEELAEFGGGVEARGEFDLERSWKLARLRCMVYTRLGDMEEEDEDDCIERDGLVDGERTPSRVSTQSGCITPAAAIFLTSIIEYMGEQALMIAGDAARIRLVSSKAVNDDHVIPDSIPEHPERLIVDDMDMEKLALNSTLGRLWRTWKKSVRSTTPRALSRESFARKGHSSTMASSRKSSICTIEEPLDRESVHEPPLAEVQENSDPASIPLPASEDDRDEIEVSGSTRKYQPGINEMRSLKENLRPRSMVVFPGPDEILASPESESSFAAPAIPVRRLEYHQRSRSLPGPEYIQRAMETSDDDFEPDFVTPSERRDESAVMYGNGEISRPSTAIPEDLTDSEYTGDSSLADTPKARTRREFDRPSNDERIDEGREEEPVPEDEEEFDSDTNSPEAHRVLAVYEPLGISESKETATTEYGWTSSRSRNQMPQRQGEMDEPEVAQASVGIPVKGASIKTTSKSVHETCEGPQSSRLPPHPNSRTLSSGNVPRYPLQPTTTSPGVERAAVQRVTPPVTPKEPGSSKIRRSASINSHRDKRPITAGSSTSQVSNRLKGLVIRQQGDTDRPVQTPKRPSSEVSGRTSRNDGEDSPNLDQLIQSDETIHYTLTPRNMRQMEVCSLMDLGENYRLTKLQTADFPLPQTPRSNTKDLAEFLRTTAPPGEEPLPQGPLETSPRRLNGLRYHPPGIDIPRQPNPAETQPSSPGSYHSRKSKAAAGQARDARTTTESVQDFANFIRSTGPSNTHQAPHSNHRHTRKLSKGQPSGYQRASFDTDLQKTSSVSRLRQLSVSTSSLGPKKPSPRLQARPATLAKGDQTSDLVDFLREGPPVGGASYTPKSVVPVRTVGDDEYNYLGPHVLDKDNLTSSSTASTQAESTITKSVHSSFNSRTGLIESGNRANARAYPVKKSLVNPNPVYGGVPAGRPVADENTTPVRKQRRVKDPYAIDTDSEDEIESIAPARAKPERKEESLADFLRDCAPPPSVNETPQLLSVNEPPPRAKSSGSSRMSTRSAASAMKSRLMRNTSVDRVPSTKLSKSSLRSSKSANAPTSASGAGSSVRSFPVPQSPSPRITHTGSQMGSHPLTSTTSYYSNHVEQQRRAKPAAPPRHPEEDAVMGRIRNETETGALADFLKSTAPPVGAGGQLAPEKERDASGSGAFSRIFVRRKKPGV